MSALYSVTDEDNMVMAVVERLLSGGYVISVTLLASGEAVHPSRGGYPRYTKNLGAAKRMAKQIIQKIKTRSK